MWYVIGFVCVPLGWEKRNLILANEGCATPPYHVVAAVSSCDEIMCASILSTRIFRLLEQSAQLAYAFAAVVVVVVGCGYHKWVWAVGGNEKRALESNRLYTCVCVTMCAYSDDAATARRDQRTVFSG